MSEGSSTETPLEIVDELTAGSDANAGWRYHYQDRMEAALERERATTRQRMLVAVYRVMEQAVSEVEEWGSYGGSDNGEPDCPRERGSAKPHARPEGLSAGARYLRGEPRA